jgi:ABC-type multidrug transport system fused ATPase/permease subunit
VRGYGPLWVFIKIIKTMYKVAPFSAAFILLSVFWQGLSVGIIFWFTSHILDNLTSDKDSYMFFWNSIGQWVLWMAIYLTMNSLLIEARVYVSSYVEKKIKLNLQQKIYSKSVSMPLSSFEDPKVLDELQNAISSLDIFIFTFLSITSVIQVIIGIVITSVVFLSYSWILLGCLILISIPPLITRAFFAKKIYEVQHSAIQGKRLADYLKSLDYAGICERSPSF